MSKRPVITRGNLDIVLQNFDKDKITELKSPITISTPISSVSIPEFLLEEPYPYFYHTWNKLLLCDLNDTKEVFHIQNDENTMQPNIYIYNKQSEGENNDFETMHKKYGNSLQNYYNVIPQTGLSGAWKEEERININNITPILQQKCDNIMTTLLFMPLDQCHDFRGGRTVGSASWVTETAKGVLKKDVDIDTIANGITENLYSNDFMNTLVKTSFSGKQNIIGIMVIGDDSHQALLSADSQYKTGAYELDIQKIMDGYGQMITIASDIMMSCDPKGNRQRINVGPKVAQVTFLGFTSDGWDKGMHDVWSMNEKKHVYAIKIDSIKQETNVPEVVYSGTKVTVIENIVPCYEMLYKSKEEGDMNAFINNYQLPDGKKLTKSNFDEFFSQANFDKLYADFLAELYREKADMHLEDTEEGESMDGGGYQQTGLTRGATYKFYGVRAPDSKSSERMTPENRTRHIIFENLFIELLKKMSKNISPQIHEDFKYPEESDDCAVENVEKINERIKKVNEYYETVKDVVNAENIQEYSKEAYQALKDKMISEGNDSKVIVKQFGTVNDMNIAPVIERVMDSLNCSDNCAPKNVEKVEEDVAEDVETVVEAVDKVEKKKDVKPCKQLIQNNINKT